MKRRTLDACVLIPLLLALCLPPAMAQRLQPGEESVLQHLSGEVEQGKEAPSRPVDSPWHIEQVDTPKHFYEGSSRALALDAEDHPHIAYGGDRLYYAWYDGTTWHLETVDTSQGEVGRYASLALDTFGRPHISYHASAPNFDLRYAYFDGTAWHIETVDSAGHVGEYTSLALDTSGRPHISYFDSDHGTLKYAYFDGTNWRIETVDNIGWGGGYTSLALDAFDRPHISYHSGYDLKYAYFDGTAWQIEVVDSGGWVGSHTSLALDASGRPHISYHASAPYYDLRYAYFDGAGWLTETVDSAGYVGAHTSLALDASDRPHISYCLYETVYWECDDLKHAYFDGTSWHTETVDTGYAGRYTSLALDASGQPHIGYHYGYDFGPFLKYAYFDGALWHTRIVDGEEAVGIYISLDLDGLGRPHIAYMGSIFLKYAYFDGAVWHVETVDNTEWVGRYPSLALDASDRPHISYVGNGLQYAYFDGAIWHIEVVTENIEPDQTSLALDASGRPHIAYYDGRLKYAYFDGSSWHIETVDGYNGAGRYASLALDNLGRPHISYSHSSDAILKYAYFDGTAWQIEVIDYPSVERTSLALDSSGRPHIVYNDDFAYLKYASFDGSSWHIETIVRGAGDASLALDAFGRPHVSYFVAQPIGLGYAYFDGTAWHTETVESTGYAGNFSSLALEASGRPHISYHGWSDEDLRYAWKECIPVEGAEITGPGVLLAGETGWYAASYTPPTATQPVTLFWDNGTLGPTAAYSWTLPGVYTLTVTAANECGMAAASFTVTVQCRPVEGVEVSGPAVLRVRETGLYTATYTPPTATLPITFTWDNGTLGPTAAYSWTVGGTYTIAVTATNRCGGEAVGHFPVQVIWPYRIYLPLVVRGE